MTTMKINYYLVVLQLYEPLLWPVALSLKMFMLWMGPNSSNMFLRSFSSQFRGIWPTNILMASGSGSVCWGFMALQRTQIFLHQSHYRNKKKKGYLWICPPHNILHGYKGVKIIALFGSRSYGSNREVVLYYKIR